MKINESQERLEAMISDKGETWDLSEKDRAAIRWALVELLRRAQNWIRVEDKLPESGKSVICCNEQWQVFVAWHRGDQTTKHGAWKRPTFGVVNNVTHWMPLPPSPLREETPNETE